MPKAQKGKALMTMNKRMTPRTVAPGLVKSTHKSLAKKK